MRLKNFLNNEKVRLNLFQGFFLLLIFLFFGYLFQNVQDNLSRQNIATGFDFLKLEAGFDIGESSINYFSDDSYGKALLVGILNTFKVALIGNFLAIILGVLIGIAGLSHNYILRKMSEVYIELVRNIPLLLQLFFWYAFLTSALPSVKEALNILPNVFLSNRGLFFPVFENTFSSLIIISTLVISIIIFFLLEKKRRRVEVKTGLSHPMAKKLNYCIFLLPVIPCFLLDSATKLSIPVLSGFNFVNGYSLSPEIMALLLGLVIYTSAFNAEITRAGMNAISKGQWEAASSLGLSRLNTIKLIILPQASRVIIPPLTSQVLNLTKNSSLAVAIGFPDFVSVVNTTMNQTGQAVECVFLIMIVYLTFSLVTSAFMNWFNKKFAIVER